MNRQLIFFCCLLQISFYAQIKTIKVVRDTSNCDRLEFAESANGKVFLSKLLKDSHFRLKQCDQSKIIFNEVCFLRKGLLHCFSSYSDSLSFDCINGIKRLCTEEKNPKIFIEKIIKIDLDKRLINLTPMTLIIIQ